MVFIGGSVLRPPQPKGIAMPMIPSREDTRDSSRGVLIRNAAKTLCDNINAKWGRVDDCTNQLTYKAMALAAAALKASAFDRPPRTIGNAFRDLGHIEHVLLERYVRECGESVVRFTDNAAEQSWLLGQIAASVFHEAGRACADPFLQEQNAAARQYTHGAPEMV